MAVTPNIQKRQDAYVFDYPVFAEIADQQLDILWTHKEIEVEKDIHNFLVDLTEAERHGVITTLKLFTKYEMLAGEEYWGERVMKMFPRPEIQRMASVFSMFELAIHAPFYDKLNQALNINTEEFYNSYLEDSDLVDRMKFIDSHVNSEDDLISLAVFSIIEGAVLYSSFAFLKHFQSDGKNKLTNVVSGINFSVKDEALHSETGALLLKTLKKEKDLSFHDEENLKYSISKACEEVYKHELTIVKKIFEKGNIPGITEKQMDYFIQSRINTCLNQLGYESMFKVKYNPIADWFYKDINSSQLHDFFVSTGNEYNRDWSEAKFKW